MIDTKDAMIYSRLQRENRELRMCNRQLKAENDYLKQELTMVNEKYLKALSIIDILM